ncbi:hypothetical protein OHC33_000918 [Knufia fluminis]|uniref:Uncharacterized protein n=1 Tax=Knufia fluminis TaxID=191047 RepID=A0AAN8EKF8_9EURO|nr:hypothetical protein OHC33_000918 [Knufia fluminis]
MAAANTTLRVPYPTYDTSQLTADIESMNRRGLRWLRTGDRVVVLVDENGVLRDIGFNSVPFNALKANFPVIKRAAAASKLRRITTVIVSAPADGLQELLTLLEDTITTAWRQNLPHPEETPLYTYNQIGEAAHGLGRNSLAELTVLRANRILDRDLRERVVNISAADVRAIYGNLAADHTLRQAVSSSIARGIIAKRIANSKELREVEEEIQEFKDELQSRKQAWSAKKKAGEDIRVPSNTY